MNDNPTRSIRETRMNSRSSKSVVIRFQAIVAILLLQVNLALAAAPPQAQSAPQNSQATPAPEAPTPAANGAAAPPPTLAQQMQQAQQQAIAPQRPFHVDLPHSHNPLAPYRPSEAPPLDLTNSPRLENLIRDGKALHFAARCHRPGYRKQPRSRLLPL